MHIKINKICHENTKFISLHAILFYFMAQEELNQLRPWLDSSLG